MANFQVAFQHAFVLECLVTAKDEADVRASFAVASLEMLSQVASLGKGLGAAWVVTMISLACSNRDTVPLTSFLRGLHRRHLMDKDVLVELLPSLLTPESRTTPGLGTGKTVMGLVQVHGERGLVDKLLAALFAGEEGLLLVEKGMVLA